MSTIGYRIKKLRLERNLTQEEVGNYIGTSKQTLYKYENGIITNIPSDKIEALSKLFDVSPGYIMGWEILKNEPPILPILNEERNKYDLESANNPNYFTSAQEAIKFLLEQNVIKALNGIDINNLSEEEQIQMANEVLDLINMVSYKYKK